MSTSFGEQLRLAREARGVTLREISEQTRISTRYLEAIETNDYRRLPGGIFNKSFIKAYAKYIGFDEREALEGYIRTANEQGGSPDDVSSTPYTPQVYTDGSVRSPIVTLVLTVMILGILSLGVYAALHWYQRKSNAAEVQPPMPPVVSSPTPQQAATKPVTQTTSVPVASSTAAATFKVEVRARGERMWLKTRVDDGDPSETTLEPDEVVEFTPTERLLVQVSRTKVSILDLNINGQSARFAPDLKGAIAELTITKENYQQFLR